MTPNTPDTTPDADRQGATEGSERRGDRPYEVVADELWHVAMPGYTHPADGSPDSDLYLTEAWAVVDGDTAAPFGVERYGSELRGFLEGAGVVRCGVEAHHRG